MDDLISRKAAIDALGEEPEVWIGNNEYEQGLNNQWHYDVNALKKLPSAQSEVIRCKDCKHWLDIDDGRQKHHMCADIYGDWFCADAERRTDV